MITDIQQALRDSGIDTWLLVNFRHRNNLMNELFGLDTRSTMSRRCAYVIPADGEPVKILHTIEQDQLPDLDGAVEIYCGWREYEAALMKAGGAGRVIAMEYSPHNAIPTIATVDAGTVDLMRSTGARVVSSADLAQLFNAVWSYEQYECHLRAARVLQACKDAAFGEIRRVVDEAGEVREYAIQQFMMRFMKARGMVTDHAPIVAANGNSARPHYAPSAHDSAVIRDGDFVLLDLWCKEKSVGSVYADITWTGSLGAASDRHREIFRIVAEARDVALAFVRRSFSAGRDVSGAQIDDVCRGAIERAGYGKYFIHRTGHSIGEECHGNGANIDNLETKDVRKILPMTCFSIEPGVYLPGEFGVRSEIDVFVHADGRVEETGSGVQREILEI